MVFIGNLSTDIPDSSAITIRISKIHLLDEYLKSPYRVSSTMLGVEYTLVNKKYSPALTEFVLLLGYRHFRQANKYRH